MATKSAKKSKTSSKVPAKSSSSKPAKKALTTSTVKQSKNPINTKSPVAAKTTEQKPVNNKTTVSQQTKGNTKITPKPTQKETAKPDHKNIGSTSMNLKTSEKLAREELREELIEEKSRIKALGSGEDHELFTHEELNAFRKMLKEEKESILQKAKAAVESGQIHIDTNEIKDDVDLATATVEQNLTFRLLDRDRKLLSGIERALEKIDSGEFGYCEGTGEPIPKRRLELRPWCRYSVKYKEQLERTKKTGRGVADDDEEY
ncbi:MAG: TraR/DksA family transcriptional regulator [Oligoflexales bacterium]|nr:TraR/DksA family transcriptional regulator [Oligoflexales bacterium]